MDAGKVGVITGASGGIAAAIARRLTERGWRLVLMSRSGAREVAAETGQIGHAGSVLQDADLEAAVGRAVAAWGRLDGVLFSGGRQSDILAGFDIPPAPPATDASFGYDPTYLRAPFDIPFAAWQANYDMNVLGPMRLFRAALPNFQAREGGAFVAISGIEATQPRLPYVLGPNRLALHGFVRLLADRYGRDGIRANCLAPGMVENAASEFPPGWVAQVPMGRYAHLTDIAAAAAFLLSDEAGYVTGQTLVVDGGVNRTAGL